MANRKNIYLTTAVFAAGLAAGAGADRVAVPVLDTAARPGAFIMAKDGYGMAVEVEAGAGKASRVLNWDRNGDAPLLDGRPLDDDGARAIGKAAVAFAAVAEAEVAKMADVLAQPASKPDPTH